MARARDRQGGSRSVGRGRAKQRKLVAIVSPGGDAAAETLRDYATRASGLLSAAKVAVSALDGSGLRRKLLNALKSRPVRALAYFGHGSRDTFCERSNGNELVLGMEDCDCLRDVIVIAMACSACARLGPTACRAGAVGFLGFTDEFLIPDSPTSLLGAAFYHPLAEPLRALATDSADLGSAFERCKCMFDEAGMAMRDRDLIGAATLKAAGCLLELAPGSDPRAVF